MTEVNMPRGCKTCQWFPWSYIGPETRKRESVFSFDDPTALRQVRRCAFNENLSFDSYSSSYAAALVAFGFVTLSLGEPFSLIGLSTI